MDLETETQRIQSQGRGECRYRGDKKTDLGERRRQIQGQGGCRFRNEEGVDSGGKEGAVSGARRVQI
jgi:hypothetical protein